MLIRVGGGRSGFAEYMERGRKAGREEDRDDLDCRLVLRGDLDEFERIVESMETDGEKYLHITLSFAEDHIPDDVLRQIDAEFHQFLTAAYPNNGEEIYVYGEAHQPRIKQAINEKTGEVHERLVHIHYAIPKTNLVTGSHENPIGIHQVNLHWLEGFQEYANEKYNLASPKDNPRISGGKGEILERQKGDEFPAVQSTKAIKEWAAGIAQKVASFDAFRQQLAEHGEVQVRNAGKANEYLWLKPEGAEKGINLREIHYRPEYFRVAPGQRPVAGKEKEYRDVAERTTGYGLQAEGEQTQWQNRMADWQAYGAKEMRWAGSLLRQQRYGITSDTPPAERLAILNGREAKFYKKHADRFEELENGYDQTDKIERGLRYGSRAGDLGDRLSDRNGSSRNTGDFNGAAGRALASRAADCGVIGTGEPVIQPLPDLLQSRAVAGRSGAADAVLSGDVPRHQGNDQQVHGVAGRGNNDSAAGSGITSLVAKLKSTDIEQTSYEIEGESSEIGQLARSLIEDIRQKSAAPRIAEIREGLKPERLLAHLAESNRLNTKLYKVEGQQIVAGRRSLSVNDFLTKEMHLAWSQAEAILHQTWGQQQRQEPYKEPEQAQVTDRELWDQFKGWKGEQIAAAKAERKAIYDQQSAELHVIRAEAKAERQEINQNARRGREGYAERQHALSVSRMGQILAEQEIRGQVARKRDSTFNKEISFREFLVERSNGGDLVALERLRRMAPEQVKEAEGNRTTGEQHQSFKQGDKAMEVMLPREALAKRGMTSSVDRSGNVSYYQGEKLLLIDQRHSVVSQVEDSATMQMQLEFAIRKFGYESLKLNGTDTFLDSMIRMAADKRFSKLTFEDKTHQARLDQYRAEFTQQEKKSAQQHPAKQDTEAHEQDQTKAPKQDPERAKEHTPKNTWSIK